MCFVNYFTHKSLNIFCHVLERLIKQCFLYLKKLKNFAKNEEFLSILSKKHLVTVEIQSIA
nr:MAG TPA: hypothetical protein [Caudoviricetes sp.]